MAEAENLKALLADRDRQIKQKDQKLRKAVPALSVTEAKSPGGQTSSPAALPIMQKELMALERRYAALQRQCDEANAKIAQLQGVADGPVASPAELEILNQQLKNALNQLQTEKEKFLKAQSDLAKAREQQGRQRDVAPPRDQYKDLAQQAEIAEALAAAAAARKELAWVCYSMWVYNSLM